MRNGFVDLQVNGYKGVGFHDPSITIDDITHATNALAAQGTAAYCPTVVTSPMDTYETMLPLLARAMVSDRRLLGIHLEGPFISPEDGAVGAHPKQFVQPPSIELFDRLFSLAEGKVALLTLAPETEGAPELIAHAVAKGVTVGIGHTLAGENDVARAVDAGATLSTHLGNGCPNTLDRHHNPIWAQLAEPELAAMIITDGHHLPPSVIRTIIAAKGEDNLIVTSDSAHPAGMPPGEYTFGPFKVLLEPSGRLRNLNAPTLAGSAATMCECMRHLASLDILDETGLWKVGRDNPLAAIGLTPERLDGLDFTPVSYVNGRFTVEP